MCILHIYNIYIYICIICLPTHNPTDHRGLCIYIHSRFVYSCIYTYICMYMHVYIYIVHVDREELEYVMSSEFRDRSRPDSSSIMSWW